MLACRRRCGHSLASGGGTHDQLRPLLPVTASIRGAVVTMAECHVERHTMSRYVGYVVYLLDADAELAKVLLIPHVLAEKLVNMWICGI